MEFLKKNLKKDILLISFLLLGNFSFGQISQEVMDAFKKSYTLEAAGKYTGAAETLKQIYQENSYEMNLRLGWLDYQAGLFLESRSFYNKAVSLRPMAVEARFGLALPLAALGNWDQLIAQYEKILEITPNNSVANYRLGSIYYGRMQYEKAASCLEKVINLYPFDYDGVILYAWTNLKIKKLREAKLLFQKALLIRPDDKSALEGLKLLE